MHVNTGVHGSEVELSALLELQSKAVVSGLMCVLGMELCMNTWCSPASAPQIFFVCVNSDSIAETGLFRFKTSLFKEEKVTSLSKHCLFRPF